MWNIESLKEHFETEFRLRDHAVDIAGHVMNQRLESMNAFREAIETANKTYLTRPEYDVNHSALSERIRGLESAAVKSATRITALEVTSAGHEKTLAGANMARIQLLVMVFTGSGVIITAISLLAHFGGK